MRHNEKPGGEESGEYHVKSNDPRCSQYQSARIEGTQGGQYIAHGDMAEFGKWEFDGKLRARVKKMLDGKVNCNWWGEDETAVVEISNAGADTIDMPLYSIFAEVYTNKKLSWSSSQSGWMGEPLPPGAHADYNFCVSGADDLLILRTNNRGFNPVPAPLK